jgi:hypothetical protein
MPNNVKKAPTIFSPQLFSTFLKLYRIFWVMVHFVAQKKLAKIR